MPLNVEPCDVTADEQDLGCAFGQMQCPAVAFHCDHGDVEGSGERSVDSSGADPQECCAAGVAAGVSDGQGGGFEWRKPIES
jgi:hypothetical protein